MALESARRPSSAGHSDRLFRHAVLDLAFALPIIYLALNGILVNPAFAAAIGYPQLAVGDAPVMIAVAVGVTLVTAWEIFDGFRHASRSGTLAVGARAQQ